MQGDPPLAEVGLLQRPREHQPRDRAARGADHRHREVPVVLEQRAHPLHHGIDLIGEADRAAQAADPLRRADAAEAHFEGVLPRRRRRAVVQVGGDRQLEE